MLGNYIRLTLSSTNNQLVRHVMEILGVKWASFHQRSDIACGRLPELHAVGITRWWGKYPAGVVRGGVRPINWTSRHQRMRCRFHQRTSILADDVGQQTGGDTLRRSNSDDICEKVIRSWTGDILRIRYRMVRRTSAPCESLRRNRYRAQ